MLPALHKHKLPIMNRAAITSHYSHEVQQDVAAAEAAAPRLRLAAQRAAKAAAKAMEEAAVAGQALKSRSRSLS